MVYCSQGTKDGFQQLRADKYLPAGHEVEWRVLDEASAHGQLMEHEGTGISYTVTVLPANHCHGEWECKGHIHSEVWRWKDHGQSAWERLVQAGSE